MNDDLNPPQGITAAPVPADPRPWPRYFARMIDVLLFGIVIYYVNVEGRFPAAQQAILFALVFGGTIALGALSDGWRWGALAWTAIALVMPLLFLGHYAVRDLWGVVFFALLFIHGLDGLRRLLQRKPVT